VVKRSNQKTLCKKLESKLDDLWSAAVKKRDHYRCRYCGKTDGLQSHHIVGRRHKSTKWDILNGITLCAGHHNFWAHLPGNEIQYSAWLECELGRQTLDYLRRRGNETQHVTYAWLQDMEQELLKEGVE
jgi:hypothetical protein